MAKMHSTLYVHLAGAMMQTCILTGKRGKAALHPTVCRLGDDAAVVEMSGWGEGTVSRAADQRGILSR